MGRESEHLAEIYCDWDSTYDREAIAQAEWQRLEHLSIISGLQGEGDGSVRRKKEIKAKYKGLYVVIQDSQKDNTTLMLVDRGKSKYYWWTHDLSIALIGDKVSMERTAQKLTRNNPRIVSVIDYVIRKTPKKTQG